MVGQKLISACFGLALALALAVSTGALAQSGSDKDSDGKFTAIAIVTGDLNWFKLFESPKTPVIKGKDVFGPGEQGTVALIFSNAKPNGGTVRVECDISAFDPKGSSVVADDAVCYEGPFYGENVLTPALLDLRFKIGKNDPDGRAGFKITLHDVNSGRRVTLNVAFEQDTGK
ncbi:MAG: hypothetical protein ABL866_04790 [Devosia sp.]